MGMNAFTPVQLGTFGILTRALGPREHDIGWWLVLFEKSPTTDLADSAWLLYYLSIQFNSWSKFMGGRKSAVSLHPMNTRQFRGGRTLDDL